MRDAVNSFYTALILEGYRQYDIEQRKWILRNHRAYIVKESKIGPYMRVDCRLKHGSASIKEGGICDMCGEIVDWDNNAYDMKSFKF